MKEKWQKAIVNEDLSILITKDKFQFSGHQSEPTEFLPRIIKNKQSDAELHSEIYKQWLNNFNK